MSLNFDLFENRYKQHRKAGKIGWSSEQSYKNHSKEIDRIIALGYVKDKGNVLELGCGAGNNSIYLAKKGFEVYGIDISAEAINWAEETAKKENIKAHFSVGDIAYLNDYKDSFFDFVYDGGVSYYVCGKRREILFKNVNRVLKPGGFFLLHAQHCDDKPRTEIIKENFKWVPSEGTFYRDGKEWGSYKLSKDIVDEVKKAGFKIINIKKEKDENPDDPFESAGALYIDCIKE